MKKRSCKLITKDIEYAVHIIKELRKAKERGEILALHKIAKTNSLSINFLEQVARKLRLSGVVKSAKGQGGGYVLHKEVYDLKSLFCMFKDVSNLSYLNSTLLNKMDTIPV